jgi:hypothetical protein
MKHILSFAGFLAVALSTSAMAQVILTQQQPQTVIVQPQPVSPAPVIVGSPPPTTIIAPGTVVAPAETVVVSRVYVPQGVIHTTAAQPAPFAPAPAGTVIETTADKRVVKTYEINGKSHTSHALLTDGLEGTRFAERHIEGMWPLTVGKSEDFTADGGPGGARHVSYRVLRTEIIHVPAGSFYTYVVERRDRVMNDTGVNTATFWYAPSIGSVVKFEERMGRAGQPRPAYELVTVRLPHAIPGTTVVTAVRRPDTVENQAMFCRERGTTLRMADGRVLVLDCSAYVAAERLSYENWLLVR